MTWRTVLALAVFVGVCGFIAYFGDLIGRRMGKRRLSLFGLRPRYTAIVSTTITGMLIAIFTIGFMAGVSSQIRTLMLQGEQILRERKAILQEYHDTKIAAKMLAQELLRQESITAKARSESTKAIHQRDILANDIAKLTSELSRLKSDLKRNQAELAKAESQTAIAKGDLASAKKEITYRRMQIAKQRSSIDRLTAQRSRLAKLFVEEMGEAASKWPMYIALREGKIIFRSNEEIARGEIRCNLPKSEIRSRVMAIYDKADQLARDKGAVNGDNRHTIQIMPKKVESDQPNSGRFLKESESVDAIVDQISSSAGSVVVRIVTVGNSVEKEQSLVEFQLYYNRRIYAPRDEVAATVIDGRGTRGQILESLVIFLRRDVRPSAIKAGIIPTFDQDGQPSVGQIAWDNLFDLADQIKSTGKLVRVKAVSTSETWSVGPLGLDLTMSDSK